MQRLDVKALGLTLGILWAVGLMLMSVASVVFNWATPWIKLIQTCYIGYTITSPGIIIGIVWAFADGFIGGALIAWLYNKLAK